MARLSYYVASTLDGFIAHEDGTFGGFQWSDEVVSDFMSDLEQFGTVLMGRKTYDVGLREGKTSPYPAMRQIVFSRSMQQSPDTDVELVSKDIVEFVKHLKASETKPIWLCGGCEIATRLLREGLIDHVTVKLNPVFFGSGIPVMSVLDDTVTLALKASKNYECGIVLLDYDVL